MFLPLLTPGSPWLQLHPASWHRLHGGTTCLPQCPGPQTTHTTRPSKHVMSSGQPATLLHHNPHSPTTASVGSLMSQGCPMELARPHYPLITPCCAVTQPPSTQWSASDLAAGCCKDVLSLLAAHFLAPVRMKEGLSFMACAVLHQRYTAAQSCPDQLPTRSHNHALCMAVFKLCTSAGTASVTL